MGLAKTNSQNELGNAIDHCSSLYTNRFRTINDIVLHILVQEGCAEMAGLSSYVWTWRR